MKLRPWFSCGVLLFAFPGALVAQEKKTLSAEEMIPFLESYSFQVKLTAAKMVGNYGTAGKPAIRTLGNIAREDIAEEVANQAAFSLAKIGPAAIEELICCLEDNRPKVRWRAAVALVWMGPEAARAVPSLMDALRDRDVSLRRQAAKALGEIGPKASPAVTLLCRLLKDTDLDVRKESYQALKNIGAEAVPELAKLLEQGDPAIRLEAVEILGYLAFDNKAALDPLVNALKDPEPQVRAATARTLATLGSKAQDAVEKLLPLLLEKNYEVQQQAFTAIMAIGAQDKAKLLESLAKINEQGQWAIPYFLAQYGPHARDAVKPLLKIVENKEDKNRLGALLALGQIGVDAKEAVPVLEKLLVEPEPQIRSNALVALYRIHHDPKEEWKKPLLQSMEYMEKVKKDLLLGKSAFINTYTRTNGVSLFRPININAFNDHHLQGKYNNLIDLHLFLSTIPKRAALTMPEIEVLKQEVRLSILNLDPEAIPALVRGYQLVAAFQIGFS